MVVVWEEYGLWRLSGMQEHMLILLEILGRERVGLFNLGYRCLLELCVAYNNILLSAGWKNSMLIVLDFVQ